MKLKPTASNPAARPRHNTDGGAGFCLAPLLAVALLIVPVSAKTEPAFQGMVLIPAGTYMPFFLQKAEQTDVAIPVQVDAFRMDVYPVTNRQFLAFVRKDPQWQKSRVKAVFADQHYLDHWQTDFSWKEDSAANAPVTNVSWFAAKAYCESVGKTLPATDQWEYALSDQGRDQEYITERALAWYAKANPAHIPNVGTTEKNGFGVYDLVGLIWEWTLDFNSFMVGSELRDNAGRDKSMFCGAGSLGVKDATDYAAFMRYSMRTSLKADYTTNNLGFRCAKEIP